MEQAEYGITSMQEKRGQEIRDSEERLKEEQSKWNNSFLAWQISVSTQKRE